jgi:hypothetical protein
MATAVSSAEQHCAAGPSTAAGRSHHVFFWWLAQLEWDRLNESVHVNIQHLIQLPAQFTVSAVLCCVLLLATHGAVLCSFAV